MNSSLVRLFPPDPSSGSAPGLDPYIRDPYVGDPYIGDPFIEDPFSAIAAEHRAPPAGRPWVLTNMVASLDGAISIDGRSGKLGGAADAIVFGALRAICDVVVVGAATATAEAYRAPKPIGEQQSRRAERGQARRPRLAIVSGSLSFPLDLPALLEAGRTDPDRTDQDRVAPVLVFTGSAAPTARLEALAEVAEVVVSPSESVHPGWLLTELAARSLRIALLEGGPTLNGQFLAADLIDEWNLTISPLLAGGTSGRAVSGGANQTPVGFELDRVWTGGGLLFGRWTRPSIDTGTTT